jgi:hypothetical protein
MAFVNTSVVAAGQASWCGLQSGQQWQLIGSEDFMKLYNAHVYTPNNLDKRPEGLPMVQRAVKGAAEKGQSTHAQWLCRII